MGLAKKLSKKLRMLKQISTGSGLCLLEIAYFCLHFSQVPPTSVRVIVIFIPQSFSICFFNFS